MFEVKIDVALGDDGHEGFIAQLRRGLTDSHLVIEQTGTFAAGGNPEYVIKSSSWEVLTLALLRYAGASEALWSSMATIFST